MGVVYAAEPVAVFALMMCSHFLDIGVKISP